jgi:hypothetical protein
VDFAVMDYGIIGIWSMDFLKKRVSVVVVVVVVVVAPSLD